MMVTFFSDKETDLLKDMILNRIRTDAEAFDTSEKQSDKAWHEFAQHMSVLVLLLQKICHEKDIFQEEVKVDPVPVPELKADAIPVSEPNTKTTMTEEIPAPPELVDPTPEPEPDPEMEAEPEPDPEPEDIPEDMPKQIDRHTCKDCEFYKEKTGKGRGIKYKCSLSGAWFTSGLGCDAFRRKK